MKRIAALLGVLALTTAAWTSLATADSGFKVTGGGQTDVGTTGAGDTIAFVAQGEGDRLKGQVQYVDREDGETVAIYHGTITCLEEFDAGEQGAAWIAGTWTVKGSGPFEIYVEDNGEGSNAVAEDMIQIDELAESPDCSDDGDDDDEEVAALGRGNVQVHGAGE